MIPPVHELSKQLCQEIPQKDPVSHWNISGIIDDCSQCNHAVCGNQ